MLNVMIFLTMCYFNDLKVLGHIELMFKSAL